MYMVVKTMRWKTAAFAILLGYTFKGRSPGDQVLYHNVLQPDFDGAINALEDNDQFLKPLRSRKRVHIYHEVIRWHADDAKHLTPPMLEAFAQAYIRLRADQSIVIATVHSEGDPHIHFVISGCNLADGKTLTRMDNKRFKAIREGIEQFQQERYPQLSNSIVYLNKPERKQTRNSGKLEKKYQLNKRQQKQQKARQLVHQCFQQAWTTDQFYDLLLEAGLELKRRKNGNISGIIYQGQAMRFSTTLKVDLKPLIAREKRLTTQELALLKNKKRNQNRHRSR